MRFCAYVVLIVLPGVLNLSGCRSTPAAEGSRFRLPVFAAPQQWEPEIDDTPADAPPGL